jgi:hypothetical protein
VSLGQNQNFLLIRPGGGWEKKRKERKQKERESTTSPPATEPNRVGLARHD